MARPIKETPVLRGKYAREFEREFKRNETKKVSRDSYQRAVATYKSIKTST